MNVYSQVNGMDIYKQNTLKLSKLYYLKPFRTLLVFINKYVFYFQNNIFKMLSFSI